MTSGGPAAKAFGDVLSPGAECMCAKHSVVLQGYGTDGVTLTAKTEYKPKYSMALAQSIEDTCRLSDQEGQPQSENKSWSWTEKLHALNHSDLEHEMALSSMEIPSPDAPITYGLSKSELIELHSSAHHERRNLDRDTDIWLSDSEGVPLSSEREHLFRVADTGNEICNIKTLDEAKASKFWPLMKEAMEEEIHGKMVNAS